MREVPRPKALAGIYRSTCLYGPPWATCKHPHSGPSTAWGLVSKSQLTGLFVGFRVHFVDFGRVYDEDFVPGLPALGADAGTLKGPLYLLRVGYSSR